MLRSADTKLTIGIAKASASHEEIDAYPVDEFIYLLKGSGTLTCADGTVTKLKTGDAVSIPKGWKGVWDSPHGYTDFFAAYPTPQ